MIHSTNLMTFCPQHSQFLLLEEGLLKNRQNGRHQEEDAGDEAGEGQCHGQGRHPRAAEQGGQHQG